jgi:cyclophilin family peptidyl-prolyl cis-trans isomerase
MAKHKAPTEVTIVPTEEKEGFSLWVERYWKMAAALGLLIAVAILALQYVRAQERSAQLASWDELIQDTGQTLVARGQMSAYVVRTGAPKEVANMAADLDGTVAGPWAWASLAASYARDGEYADAEKALGELRNRHPKSYLADARFRFGEDATPRTLAEQANRNYQDWARWESEHSSLFENPPLPADAPKVKIRTDKGDIEVGLYSDKAPQHVENFLKLCREGYYDGTAFHRVIQGFMIQGGDPNSRDGDPSTWGQGGPDEGVPSEPNDLKHFRGYLAAAKSDPKGDSSGSQFYITVAPAHQLDADYTVFGKVLSGMETADEIAEGEIAEGTRDRPANPVRVLGTDVL